MGQVFNSHLRWDHGISINHIDRVFIRHWRSVSMLVPMPPPKFLSKVLFRSGEYPAIGLHSSSFSTYLHEKPLLIFLFILGNESNSTRRNSWSCHTHEIPRRPSSPRNKNKQRRTKGPGTANKNTNSEQERLHAFFGNRSLIYPQFQQFYL